MKKINGLVAFIVVLICSIAHGELVTNVVTEGFEYSTTAELYTAGWSHIYGSPGDMVMANSATNSRLPRSGTYCLLAPGDKTPNVIEKTFSADGLANTTVEFYLVHRTGSNLNAARSLMFFKSDDAQSAMQLYFDQNTGQLLYKLTENGTQGAQTAAPGSLVNSTTTPVIWNKFTIEYDASGSATVYLNDVEQFIFAGAKNFSKIALGRSWAASAAVQSAFDDLTVTTVETVVPGLTFEGFEYSTTAELYAAGWSHLYGSSNDMVMANSSTSSRLPRTGDYCLLAPGDKTPNVVEKTFSANGEENVTIEFYLLHRTLSNLNAARSLIILESDDAQSAMKLYFDQNTGQLLYKLTENGTQGAQTAAPGSLVNSTTTPVVWNKFTIKYAYGYATVYLNDEAQFTFAGAKNFSKIALGRSWDENVAVQSAFDDLSILQVEVPDYNYWAASWGGVDIGAATNDYDGDFYDNLWEYAMDGDPTNSADRGVLPILEYSEGVLTFVHGQRTDDTNLVYYLETRNDLMSGSWTNSGYTVTGTNITGSLMNYVTNEISTVTNQTFIRICVESP